MADYRVDRNSYGIAIYGPVPVNDMCALIEGWAESDNYDLLDALIAQRIEATFVIVSKRNQRRWRNDLNLPLGDADTFKKRFLWAKREVSEATPGAKLLLDALNPDSPRPNREVYPVPIEPYDFQACIRVIEIMPEWYNMLDVEFGRLWPRWEPIVAHWDELESLAKTDKADGGSRLEERLEDLLEDDEDEDDDS